MPQDPESLRYPWEDKRLLKKPDAPKGLLEGGPSQAERSKSTLRYLGDVAYNAPESAWRQVEGLYNVFRHPIGTAKTMTQLAVGLTISRAPGEGRFMGRPLFGPKGEEAKRVYQALESQLRKRYGDVDAVRESFRKDPVGVIADVSAAISLAGGFVKHTSRLASEMSRPTLAVQEAPKWERMTRLAEKVENAIPEEALYKPRQGPDPWGLSDPGDLAPRLPLLGEKAGQALQSAGHAIEPVRASAAFLGKRLQNPALPEGVIALRQAAADFKAKLRRMAGDVPGEAPQVPKFRPEVTRPAFYRPPMLLEESKEKP